MDKVQKIFLSTKQSVSTGSLNIIEIKINTEELLNLYVNCFIG